MSTVRSVTLERDVVGSRKSGEITITRGMDKSTAFTDWIKVTLVNADLDSARQSITIAMKNAKKQTVRRIHLSNAWVSRWDGPSLGASSSGPATEQVTITYGDSPSSSHGILGQRITSEAIVGSPPQ